MVTENAMMWIHDKYMAEKIGIEYYYHSNKKPKSCDKLCFNVKMIGLFVGSFVTTRSCMWLLAIFLIWYISYNNYARDCRFFMQTVSVEITERERCRRPYAEKYYARY